MGIPARLRAVAEVSWVMVAAVVLSLTSSSEAQETEKWKLLVTPPEDVRTVWRLRAKHVASELELDPEAERQLVNVYLSARGEHCEKVERLPKTDEGLDEFWRIGEEEKTALEKSLVEVLGKEKGHEAAVALGAFNFFADNMAADILAAQDEALKAVIEYDKNINKVVGDARECGIWEGVRFKFEVLTVGLSMKTLDIFSEAQVIEWEEKYRPIVEQADSLLIVLSRGVPPGAAARQEEAQKEPRFSEKRRAEQ